MPVWCAVWQSLDLPLPERMQLDAKRRQEKLDARMQEAADHPPASAQLAFNVEDMLQPYVHVAVLESALYELHVTTTRLCRRRVARLCGCLER